MQISKKAAPVYFKNLDGLRFLAALFVIVGHCQSEIEIHFNINPYTQYADKLANFGVDFFFVLSGFLISYLLFEELEKTGTVHVGKFYMRRILRLWPLYFIFSFTCILGASYYTHFFNFLDRPQTWAEMRENLLHLITFSTNFQILSGMNYPGGYTIGHFWSLSVEEQFYLIWAPLIYFFRKRVLLLLFLTTIIGIVTTLWQPDIYQVWYKGNAPNNNLFATYCRFMFFGSGAFLAYFVQKQAIIAKKFPWNDSWNKYLQIGFSIFVLYRSGSYLFGTRYYDQTEVLFINVLMATALVLIAILKYTVVNLEFKFLKYLGKISFGIYVFHFFAIHLVWHILDKQHITGTTFFVLLPIFATLVAILLAALSYRFIETWFLKQKHRFTF
jgi:peptidoglycan/LPS O-acetylase OafA/YrhL